MKRKGSVAVVVVVLILLAALAGYRTRTAKPSVPARAPQTETIVQPTPASADRAPRAAELATSDVETLSEARASEAITPDELDLLSPERTFPSDAPGGFVLVGRVEGSTPTGATQPIEGAVVSAGRMVSRSLSGGFYGGEAMTSEWSPAATAVTDADGYYETPLPIGPPFDVTVSAEQYASDGLRLYVVDVGFEPDAEGRRVIRQDFTLVRARPVSVRVIDAADQPVAGADVTVVVSLGWLRNSQVDVSDFTQTGADGRFLIRDANSPVQGILVSREDLGSHWFGNPVTPDSDEEVVLQLGDHGAELHGIVVLRGTDDPVAGALVQLLPAGPVSSMNPDRRRWTTESDAEGRFAFRGLPGENYHLAAEAEDLRVMTDQHALSIPVEIETERVRENVRVELAGPRTVVGVVRNNLNGAPISGAIVSATGNAWSLGEVLAEAVTDGEGQFELSGFFARMPRGGMSLALRASHPGYLDPDQAVELSFEAGQEVRDGVELFLAPEVRVRGYVRAPSGLPIRGATILARYDWGITVTDASGAFELRVPARAQVQLTARAEGYTRSTYSDVFTAPDEGVMRHDVTLDPGATIIVNARDEDGNPIPKASIVLMVRATLPGGGGSAAWFEQQETGTDGVVRFEHVQTAHSPLPVRFESLLPTVTGGHEEYDNPGEIELPDLRPGETEQLMIIFTPRDASGLLVGVVVDADGEPVENAFLQMYPPDHSSFQRTTTDVLGAFRVANIRPGAWRIEAAHPQKGTWHDNYEANGEEIRIQLRPRP